MKDQLKTHIKNLLKKDTVLSFTSDSGMQGGPLVEIFLNEKHIGEVYTYNTEENRQENISHGNSFELELADALKDWVHDAFYQFLCKVENHHLLTSFHKCSFRIEEENIILSISIIEEEDMDEEIYSERETTYENHEHALTDFDQ